MVDGRSPKAKVRPLVLWGPTGAALWRREHCGSGPQIIKSGTWRTGRSPSTGLGEGVVAQGAQGVVAASGQLAGDRQGGPVGAESVSDLEVVVVVG
jgi:hypothetical protein